MPNFDRSVFNTDPKHEQDRKQFDEMVEDAFERIAKRKEKEKPPEEPNFFDRLFGGK